MNSDERMRGLERAAATDPVARDLLAVERNRRGFCGRCATAKPEAKIKTPVGEIGLCGRCAALEEFLALERSTKTYTGYLAGEDVIDPREVGGTAPRPWLFITTFNGFPLAVVVAFRGVGDPRRDRSFRSVSWNAADRLGRQWYGRNAGHGMVTGMRLRKRDQWTMDFSASDPGITPSLRDTSAQRTYGVPLYALCEAQDAWLRGEPWLRAQAEPDELDIEIFLDDNFGPRVVVSNLPRGDVGTEFDAIEDEIPVGWRADYEHGFQSGDRQWIYPLLPSRDA